MSQKKRKGYQITDDDNENEGIREINENIFNIKKIIDICHASIVKLNKQVELLKHSQDEINSKLQIIMDRPVANQASDSEKPTKLLTDLEEV
jgi:hypothetical protein